MFFIEKLSTDILVITEKLKENKPLEFNEAELISLRRVFKRIQSNVQLYFPNIYDTFYLETDVSETKLDAALYQRQKLIGLFSKN